MEFTTSDGYILQQKGERFYLPIHDASKYAAYQILSFREIIEGELKHPTDSVLDIAQDLLNYSEWLGYLIALNLLDIYYHPLVSAITLDQMKDLLPWINRWITKPIDDMKVRSLTIDYLGLMHRGDILMRDIQAVSCFVKQRKPSKTEHIINAIFNAKD